MKRFLTDDVNHRFVRLVPLVARIISAACLISYSVVTLGQDAQPVRGLVNPKSQAVMSSEIAAKVILLPFSSGDAFNKEDTLVEFDCSLYQAQLDAALAGRDIKTKEYQNAAKLLTYKATSRIEVEIARSEMREAEARYKIENLKVEGCSIKAPYKGRVIALMTNEYETVNRGTELLSVLSDEQLEIELIVPSAWLGWLRKGDRFGFHIDETNRSYSATVSRIGAMVDPISQTIEIIALFDESHQDVLSGMSGNAVIERIR
ncbi:MAG: membrane fusion protein (multidrug efflux system) [Candidatus Azotimanducaceae bacterium]